jgi:hypothetical protein|tara:strand:- start:203 stop:706 length:504 start_codon:yes stop_codon:yes gene_type:complete
MAIYFPNSEMSEVIGESWRITSTFSSDANPVLNWERSDDVYGGGNLSYDVLNYSNGIFSFNSNHYGWYLFNWQHYTYFNDNSRWNEMICQVSWNNGANYDNHGYSASHMSPNTSSNYSAGGSASSMILGNANTRIRWNVQVENNGVYTYGTTSEQMTGFSCIYVGEP